MNKNFYLVCFLILIANFSLKAQARSGWGIKGGLNYGSGGDINLVDTIEATVDDPSNNLGWHLGIYGKLGNLFYIRPELVYTNLSADYNNNKFKMQKLDLPVLAGLKIFGPLHIFIGPSFQFILDTDLENFSLNDVENNFTVGLNAGVGINLGKFGIDVRYEGGFSKNEADIIQIISGEIIGRLDTRPEQVIVSLSYRFNQ